MVGRQLPFFSLLVPFWLVWAQVGWRRMVEVWPACLVAGALFGSMQFLISNYHGPWLVNIVSVATGGNPDSPSAGTILRSVFWHSVALALLVGVLVMIQAYVWTSVVPSK